MIFQKTAHGKPPLGFTIVELLIVIVVIAILAAISIVAYNGIQGRANDTAVQSDLANLAKKMELYKNLDSTVGGYPLNGTQLGTIEDLRVSRGSYNTQGINNLVYCVTVTTGDAYAFVAKSTSGNGFYVSSAGKGTITLTGGISGAATCNVIGLIPASDGGTGGVSAGYSGTTNTWNTWID